MLLIFLTVSMPAGADGQHLICEIFLNIVYIYGGISGLLKINKLLDMSVETTVYIHPEHGNGKQDKFF